MKITKDENSKNVPQLEITKVVLAQCNFDNNDYYRDLRVLDIIIPNKLIGQLLGISPKNFILLKTFNSEFSDTEVWFTDQNSKTLEIEDIINLTLVIN